MARATCPNCRGPVTVSAGDAAVTCPACKATIRVKPKAAPLPPPPPPAADPFAFEPPTAVAKRPARPKRGGGFFWAVLVGLLAVGLGVGAVALKLVPTAATAPTAAPPVEVVQAPAKPDPFPRRLLVVSVNRYLYCNRLTAGSGRQAPDLPTEIGKRLAFDWRVPQEPGNTQLTVLTDAARPVFKPAVEQVLADFCRTSRPQDRVLIYFGGHAVEASNAAFLVPAEGDPDEPAGLIPVADVFARLKDCPAAQRVIVFDVCRLNEDDDRVRPGSEPLTPSLEKLLTAAPPGVQVVLTCSAGQTAHEFRRPPPEASAGDVTGSLFLSAVRHVAARGRPAGEPKPDDPLPVSEWLAAVSARVAAVCEATGRPKQTPKLVGAAGQLPPADPAAPPAVAVVVPPSPPGPSADELAKLTAAIALPPIRERPTENDDAVTLPVPAEALKGYQPTPADTPLREAANETLAEVRKLWAATTGEGGGLRTEFTGDTNEAVKRAVAKDQETPARIGLALEDRDRMLTALEGQLEGEKSAYWRATFRFAQAQVKARLAFMQEYNQLLADVRADRLPARDPKAGETGLQLVSVAKMKSKKDVQELAEAARGLFAGVAKDHPNTPWAVAAKRAKAEALGLEWRPFAPGGKPKPE